MATKRPGCASTATSASGFAVEGNPLEPASLLLWTVDAPGDAYVSVMYQRHVEQLDQQMEQPLVVERLEQPLVVEHLERLRPLEPLLLPHDQALH